MENLLLMIGASFVGTVLAVMFIAHLFPITVTHQRDDDEPEDF